MMRPVLSRRRPAGIHAAAQRHPRRRVRRGLWSAALLAALLAGCTTPRPQSANRPPVAPARSAVTSTQADPATWIGRWHGDGARRLDIYSTPGNNSYRLVFRNAQGVPVTHLATASNGRLFYEGGQQRLALRPGTGAETDSRAMQNLSQCLIVVPGSRGYCRRADTADALALQHGAFVAIRRDCNDAAPADVLFFDGQRLYPPAANAACQTRVVGQQGILYSLANSCEPGAGASGRINETLGTPDDSHLAVTPTGEPTALYRYCATGLLAPGLKRLAPR